MIIPVIYDQNEAKISSDLLPIKKRKPKWLAWLSTLLYPLQWCHDLIFVDYYAGSSVAVWQSAILYIYQNRVVYYDGCVYELQSASLISPTPPPQDPANWLKILDTWVGVAERVQYNGQKIMLEYALNKYFSLFDVTIAPSLPFIGASQTTQIFISELSGITGEFWLTNGSAGNQLTSYMSNGAAQMFFLGNSYKTYVFTINVPAATDAAITAKQVSPVIAEDVVRAFADKYIQAGYKYTYATY